MASSQVASQTIAFTDRKTGMDISFELGDLSDKQGESFDNTKLSAVNTCPTWGITRYGMHKAMPKQYANARAMALEQGQAAHDAFAAVRLAQVNRSQPDHATFHAVRIFGKDRATSLLAVIRHAPSIQAAITAVAIEALATSGFTDDPFDRRRTMANLEGAVTAYAAGYDFERWPVWYAEERDPSTPIGIEQPYNVLMSLNGSVYLRLTGKIDAIHWHREEHGEVILHDNKTAGRIDATWIKGWDMSHQITGYVVAASLLSRTTIRRAVIRGLQIPLPKMIIDGMQDVWMIRDQYHIARWVQWLVHTVNVYQRYKGNPKDAPKYTHSCTRFFRPCSMIPFCTADDAEQDMILSEMETDEWTPLVEQYDG